MAKVTLKGNEIHTNGELPKVGTEAPDFKGVKSDLSELSLSDLKGKKVVINVFPSLDTSVCAASVRRFNKEAASHPDTVVLAVSKDLPFAHGRFCTTEGIDKVITLSVFRCSCFEDKYGMLRDYYRAELRCGFSCIEINVVDYCFSLVKVKG